MQNALINSLSRAPVIPLIDLDDPSLAAQVAKALCEGGLNVLEVVLRSERALECLREVSRSAPDAIVGAGTLLDATQTREALACGAEFIVSPGLHSSIVETARSANAPVIPGVATASEVLAARNLGLKIVKFFPAEPLGGEPLLRAYASVFRDLQFIPTGGIDQKNLAKYLRIPSVIACGGSWIASPKLARAKRFEQITSNAREALSIALEAVA